jgi:hypothetical protein
MMLFLPFSPALEARSIPNASPASTTLVTADFDRDSSSIAPSVWLAAP